VILLAGIWNGRGIRWARLGTVRSLTNTAEAACPHLFITMSRDRSMEALDTRCIVNHDEQFTRRNSLVLL